MGSGADGASNIATAPQPVEGRQRLWTQREAAEFLSVSERYLRASSVPKLLLPGTGPRGKPLVRYCPSDVIEWSRAYRTHRRFD
jgi:hypothetical protein